MLSICCCCGFCLGPTSLLDWFLSIHLEIRDNHTPTHCKKLSVPHIACAVGKADAFCDSTFKHWAKIIFITLVSTSLLVSGDFCPSACWFIFHPDGNKGLWNGRIAETKICSSQQPFHSVTFLDVWTSLRHLNFTIKLKQIVIPSKSNLKSSRQVSNKQWRGRLRPRDWTQLQLPWIKFRPCKNTFCCAFPALSPSECVSILTDNRG